MPNRKNYLDIRKKNDFWQSQNHSQIHPLVLEMLEKVNKKCNNKWEDRDTFVTKK